METLSQAKAWSTILHLRVGQTCNNLEKGKPRKAGQVFLQIQTEARYVLFKCNPCSGAGIPLFSQDQCEGVEPQSEMLSFPGPGQAIPGTDISPLSASSLFSFPAPPSHCTFQLLPHERGTRHGKDPSASCAKHEGLLDLESRRFSSPQKTLVAFLPAVFVLLQALSEADSRAAALFLE